MRRDARPAAATQAMAAGPAPARPARAASRAAGAPAPPRPDYYYHCFVARGARPASGAQGRGPRHSSNHWPVSSFQLRPLESWTKCARCVARAGRGNNAGARVPLYLALSSPEQAPLWTRLHGAPCQPLAGAPFLLALAITRGRRRAAQLDIAAQAFVGPARGEPAADWIARAKVGPELGGRARAPPDRRQLPITGPPNLGGVTQKGRRQVGRPIIGICFRKTAPGAGEPLGAGAKRKPAIAPRAGRARGAQI